MKKFDKVMALKKTIINNIDAPEDFESKIGQTIKTGVKNTRFGRDKINYIRILQYASALVLCFAFIIGLFYMASFIKNNKNVATEESPKQVNFNSPASDTMTPKPSPTPVNTIRSKVENLLEAFNLGYKNFERLKEIEPDLWLVVDTKRQEINQKRTASRTLPKDYPGYSPTPVDESAVLAFAKSIYGEQVVLKNTKVGEITTPGLYKFYYYPTEKLYSYPGFGGYHRYKPYILEYTETDNSIIATVVYIKYSGQYMEYDGPYFNEDNVQIGTLPEGSESPLTLEQVAAIKEKLVIRYFVFEKLTDINLIDSLHIKSCWITEPGANIIPGRYTSYDSLASTGFEPYIEFKQDGTFMMFRNSMEGTANYKGNYTIEGNIITIQTTERLSYKGSVPAALPADFKMMIVNKNTLIYSGPSGGATQYSDSFRNDVNSIKIEGIIYPAHLTFADGIYNISVEDINKIVIHNDVGLSKETADKQIISNYLGQLSNQTYTIDPNQGDRTGGSYWISLYSDKYGEISATTHGFSRFNSLDKDMYGKRIYYYADDFNQVLGIFKALYNEL